MFYWLDNFIQCLLPFNILRRFNQMDRGDNGLDRQAGMTCLGQSCGPRMSGPCRVVVWPSIGVQRINLK
jgi:hypothetical protein